MLVQIELYDVAGGVTSIRTVPILELHGSPTALDLQDALPLGNFLAPVASCKDALASALETLEPCESGSFFTPLFRSSIKIIMDSERIDFQLYSIFKPT